jgi:CRP-like cAMP-binding protein
VLHRQRRVLIAEANEPTVILHVPLVELNRLREEHPDAGRAIGQLAMLGEATYLAIVTDLLIPGADRRLAAVLLRVTGTEGPHLRGSPPGDAAVASETDPRGVALTQALLADLANASRHTVARFVDRAGRAGWLDWRYGRVRVRDAEALAAFAAGR